MGLSLIPQHGNCALGLVVGGALHMYLCHCYLSFVTGGPERRRVLQVRETVSLSSRVKRTESFDISLLVTRYYLLYAYMGYG